MQEKTDAQLLRDYAEHRDEAAFRELVSRYADVVYASALRQVSSPDLAHDIAQSVFTDLARKAQPLAGTLTGDASLLGWLFRSTRFLALNQLRDDRRRHARERHAMQHFDPASETAPEWERVQPVLDEAMADLSDEDRDALLLRFFKNRDFRTIGASLGVSDDAAQKRVSRALDRLRTHLTSRGVTTTAIALSTALSANAVPIAPAGLAATLSTAALAGTTLATTATATTIKTIAMTTLQKTIITAALAAAVGTGIYKARQTSTLHSQNQAGINACIDHLRLIDGARTQCALENSLTFTNAVTTEQILPYIIGHQLPQCPSGGTYTFGKLTNPPTCSIRGHVLTPLPRLVRTADEQAEFQALTEAIEAYKRNPSGPAPEEFPKELDAAWKSYHTKNPGQRLTDLNDIEPYTTTPDEAVALMKLRESLAK